MEDAKVIYNSRATVSGIPEEAYEYMRDFRPGIGWGVDRYQAKVDKASQIKDDLNAWCREVENSKHILDLVARVARVSVETVRLVAALPALGLGEGA